MNTVERIHQDVSQLSEPMAQQVLNFVHFLKLNHEMNTPAHDVEYQQAKERTLQRMQQGYHLGGDIPPRDSLHER